MERISSRISELLNKQVEGTQDWGFQLKKAQDRVQEGLRITNHDVIKMRSLVESAATENSGRLQQLEDRCCCLEARISEQASRQASGLERLAERNEQVSNLVEQVRLQERSYKPELEGVLNRFNELEAEVRQCDVNTHEILKRDRKIIEQQLNSEKYSVLEQQERKFHDIEGKLASRLERESEARTQSVRRVMEDVGVTIET